MTEDQSPLLRAAERQILADSGESVRLLDPEPLPSPHLLLRCRVEGAPWSSVIVKRVTTSRFTSGQDTETSHRHLNEWSTLAFLRTLPVDGPWPDLVAANREESFVVIEDLGSHRTVEEILLSREAVPAEQSLQSMGTSLGRLHALSRGQTSQFTSMRDSLDGAPPRSDSTYDLRQARDVFEECFETMDITPSPGFWEDVADLESALHDPGLFTTLIHADAGAQNFVWTGEESVLIDFEFATVSNAMLDLVSARLGFPHSSEAHTVPLQFVDRLEDNYRLILSRVIPQVADDAAFQSGTVDACAHWALGRMGALWRRLFLDEPDGPDDAHLETMRSQAFTVYRRFVETAAGTGFRVPIAATVDTFTRTVERRWPGLTEMPVYPALASDLSRSSPS